MHKSNSVWHKGFIVFALTLAGCASIISGTSQDVKISSSPAAANIKVERSSKTGMETVWQGQTPANVSLKRKYAYLLSVSLDGYQPIEMPLESSTNGWVWGNLLFGGLIGLVIDYSNGAAKKLEPDQIDVQLVSVVTAHLHQDMLYAVFRIQDTDGALRVAPVPLVPLSN
jgi:hypothetical protein